VKDDDFPRTIKMLPLVPVLKPVPWWAGAVTDEMHIEEAVPVEEYQGNPPSSHFATHQKELMTAAVMWFLILSVLGVAGAFVLKLIGAILGF
jgi:hypothetical protein